MKRSIVHEAALQYAELGYPVFPCVSGDKTPQTTHGYKDATTDLDQIDRWWTQKPSPATPRSTLQATHCRGESLPRGGGDDHTPA